MLTELTREAPLQATLTRHVLNGPTMGSRFAAVFFAPPAIDPAIGPTLQAAVDTVDRQMSTWIADSDLTRFNRAAPGNWVELPEELMTVLAAGLEIGRLSDGAFDVGVGEAVTAWGFGPARGTMDRTAQARLTGEARPPAHAVLELDPVNRLARKQAPVALDLSGIAKGYGVDRLAETLERFGIAAYLVSINGELRAGGRKPDGQPWQVAVEAPERGIRTVAGLVELEDGALATSGDYRHFVEVDGVTHAHTIDPRTGQPLQNGVAAVTVRATTCMAADAWATALMVLCPEAGLPLARAHGIEALFATA